jgi:hypothetical protein
MAPIYVARGLADGRCQELLAEAVARRPAAALAPRAYGPLAI